MFCVGILGGLNATSKQLAIFNVVETSGCSVICLQETKMGFIDLALIRKCCPRRFDDFVYVPSNGAFGGLLIIWDSSLFNGIVMHYQPFSLSVHFTSTQSAQSWTLINIYGPCAGDMRDQFVQWLYQLNIPDDEDWLLLGDFNFIRGPANRNKPGGNVNDMLTFNDFIRAQHLTELKIQGRSFTWSNMQDSPLLEQLDWFFTSLHWTLSYPATSISPQCKPTSDHTPLLVTIQTTIPGSKIFRFENYWTTHRGFLQMVANSWNKPTHKSNSAANLNAKFKRLRYDIKHWSKSISKLKICIQNCNKAILELDNLEDRRALSVPEKNFKKIIKKHLITLLEYQQQYWKKRCTIRWTKLGDENTKFFQAIATERHRRNNISSPKTSGGVEINDHTGKAEVIYNSFKERLRVAAHPEMLFDLQSLITPIKGLDVLSTPFTTQEIDVVIAHMPSDKAPGPDGFNGHFLKVSWQIIKHDIYKLYMDFHSGNLNLESLNTWFITLIPQGGHPREGK